MIKVRTFPESNYRAIWINHKTIRIALDPSQPITELQYPEFLDIKLTNYCNGGCKFCYMDSVPDVGHYQNVVGKIKESLHDLVGEPIELTIVANFMTTVLENHWERKSFTQLNAMIKFKPSAAWWIAGIIINIVLSIGLSIAFITNSERW